MCSDYKLSSWVLIEWSRAKKVTLYNNKHKKFSCVCCHAGSLHHNGSDPFRSPFQRIRRNRQYRQTDYIHMITENSSLSLYHPTRNETHTLSLYDSIVIHLSLLIISVSNYTLLHILIKLYNIMSNHKLIQIGLG